MCDRQRLHFTQSPSKTHGNQKKTERMKERETQNNQSV